MRIVYKRKVIILATVLLLLLFSIVALFLYYKDSFSSSKYFDIYSQCEKSIKDGKNIYTCKALLVNRLDKGNEECFVFDLVLGSKMINKSICEKAEVITWSKEDLNWGDTEGAVIPIEIIFSERYNLPIKSFNMVDIAINRLEDEKISPLISELEPTYNVGNILTYEREKLENKGYTIAINKEMELGYLYFKEVSFKEITLEGDSLLVKLTAFFQGQEKDFTVKTVQFSYRSTPYVNEKESIPLLIDKSNYMNYSSDDNLSMSLIYIPEASSLLQKDLNSICEDKNQAIYPICFHLPIINSGISTVSDVDKTLAEIVDGDGFLEPFILVSMSKND